MFAAKARGYPSEGPLRYSTLGQALGLTQKHRTWLEKLARDSHCSLSWKGVNYGCKMFYSIAPWSHDHTHSLFLSDFNQCDFLNLTERQNVWSSFIILFLDSFASGTSLHAHSHIQCWTLCSALVLLAGIFLWQNAPLFGRWNWLLFFCHAILECD